MIWELIAIYGSILLGCIISTTILVVLGRGWGPLPHYYLELIRWIQNHYRSPYLELDEIASSTIIQKSATCRLTKTTANSTAQFPFLDSPRDHFEIALDAAQSGIEAIIQDDLSSAFDPAPSYTETLLRFSPLPHWSATQKAVFYATFLFRIGVLFPIRVCLLIISFAVLAGTAFLAVSKDISEKEKMYLKVVYARLYCCAMGNIVTFNNVHLRPKSSGVAISNHLSPNDVQVLFAGTPHGSSHGFVLTGQKHKGFIGSLEALADKVSPTIWVERGCADGRRKFLDEIIKRAKLGIPVLLFPEGFCSNNTQVLQFRKAIFEDGVNICPIAIRQDSRFGDAFWSENRFWHYLLRVMTSWALPLDITYLAPLTRQPQETNMDFAARAQSVIAEVVGVPAGQFDGSLYYRYDRYFN
ncbi:unnamed protein product [Nippostrongylus brasiliensis]|uniref:PlsC domain-containing protein n=1 Tax=Nippostrongylus brasiliensis TaxID=27835 RepID=A0A0N4Y5F7_NIPBR|nr:unnamed protein product [Nippostrongylus brasiliensis]